MKSGRWLLKYFPYIIIILSFTTLIMTVFAFNLFARLDYQRTFTLLEETANLVKNSFPWEDPKKINLYCRRNKDNDVRITIIDKSGKVLGDSQEDVRLMDNHSSRPEVLEAKESLNGIGIARRHSRTLDRPFLYYAMRLPYEDDVIIRTSISIQSLNRIFIEYSAWLFLIAVVVFVVTGIVSYTLVRSINKPMKMIQQAADEYARGNFDYYIQIDNPPELAKLSHTLTSMADELNEKISDITRQKNEYLAVLKNMSEPVIVCDENLRIMEINSAALLYTPLIPETVRGKKIHEAFNNKEFIELAEKLTKEGRTAENEVIYRFKDRNYFIQIKGVKAPLLYEARENMEPETVLIFVLNDISKLKELENIRKDFVANVSHELKTPITSIKGYVETVLQDEKYLGDMTRSFLEIVRKQTDRIHAIIEDLLVLSRLEHENIQIRKHVSSINELVSRCIELCRPKIKNKNITVTYTALEPVSWGIDAFLLEQALVNLIDNAVKYSKENSNINISTTVENNSLLLSVSDNGCGIPILHQDRVFERFYMVDKGRSRKQGGTGLGLSIVKHIALLHEGSVSLKSRTKRGSTFTITIPDDT